jgi:hypothetical protein
LHNAARGYAKAVADAIDWIKTSDFSGQINDGFRREFNGYFYFAGRTWPITHVPVYATSRSLRTEG